MTYSLEIKIQDLPDLPNRLFSQHWTARHKHNKKWHTLVALAVGHKAPDKPLTKARLTLTRHSCRAPDPDNLAASFKPVIDGLRYALVIADDNPNVVSLEFHQERAGIKKGFITVRVDEVLAANKAG
jgi:hypothetical protein